MKIFKLIIGALLILAALASCSKEEMPKPEVQQADLAKEVIGEYVGTFINDGTYLEDYRVIITKIDATHILVKGEDDQFPAHEVTLAKYPTAEWIVQEDTFQLEYHFTYVIEDDRISLSRENSKYEFWGDRAI